MKATARHTLRIFLTGLLVLAPAAPLPVGGGLIFVPGGWVTPAEVGMEALTSIYVSMGVTAHQHLGRSRS